MSDWREDAVNGTQTLVAIAMLLAVFFHFCNLDRVHYRECAKECGGLRAVNDSGWTTCECRK